MNMRLNKSIRQILLTDAATTYTVEPQDPPGSGQVQDYFGVTSNYATSPDGGASYRY